MNNNEYSALRTDAAYEIRSNTGILALSDNDRVDFLHRMTTNDIAALNPNEANVTVLPSPTARILFVFTVIAQADRLLCLPAPGQAEALSKYLRGQIFFMDKVKVTDLSESFVRIRLMGPQAEAKLIELGWANVDVADEGTVLNRESAIAVKQEQYEIPGFELIVPVNELGSIVEGFEQSSVTEVSDGATLTTRRIELGCPAVEHELIDTYSPLESGLAWTCAENKGCYTGQEIIARQITYDKVTKTLVGLRSDAAFEQDDDVIVDGRRAGQVTSAVHSPTLGQYIGLAVLKRPHNEPGTEALIGGVPVTVEMLPLVR